jgi:hypothetical protein
MKKLTDAAIKAARCPEGKDRLELSDASCPGLILRVTKTGSKTFLFKYWSPLLSKTVGLTLGSYPDVDLAAARAKVADHRKTISLDEDPRRIQRAQRRQAAREEELSFDEFADLYIVEYVKGPGFPERPNKKSWQNDVGYPPPIVSKIPAPEGTRSLDGSHRVTGLYSAQQMTAVQLAIRLLVLQGREDASLFEAPAVDDSDDCGKCEESDHRDLCELLRRDMIGHQ